MEKQTAAFLPKRPTKETQDEGECSIQKESEGRQSQAHFWELKLIQPRKRRAYHKGFVHHYQVHELHRGHNTDDAGN